MRPFLLLLSMAIATPAFAQDEESDPFKDLLTEDEDDSFNPTPAPQPTEALPTDFEDPEEDDEFGIDDPETGDDLLGEDPNANTNLGADNAETYRATLAKVEGMDPDDEMQIWDAYLAQYPNTAFRPQIEKRKETLEDDLYNLNRIRPKPEPGDAVDADKKQLSFSQGLLIENINPRRRLQFTFEWGLPDFGNLGADYEHPLARNFSLHGGIRRRFTGVNIEAGARWALVKSARTNTLVTFIGDIHLNTSPAYVGFRPQLAFGKRFGKLDLQAQAGIDVAPRATLDLRFVGGMNATVRATDAVAMFVETSIYMHSKSGDAGLYRFNQFTFGMKFFPRQKAEKPENTEVNVGASLPYSSAYWQYHFGSLMAQGNIYLD